MKTDLPLKRLTQLRPADLLLLIGAPTAEVVGVETLELPASTTSLDTVLRLRQPDGQDYLHLVEWQGYKDDRFLWRVMGYLSWLGQHYDERPILATLIYLTPDDDVGSTVGQATSELGGWSVTFSCARLWEQEAAAALAIGTPGLLTLLPLMHGATAAMVGEAVQGIVAQVEGKAQSDLLVALGVFAAPLIAPERFKQLVTKERLMASDLISLLVEEAVQEAVEEKTAEFQQVLHVSIEDAVLLRFPMTAPDLLQGIRHTTEIEALQQLLAAVLRAADQAELDQLLRAAGAKPEPE